MEDKEQRLSKMQKILLPMIRKVMPALVANEIVGVQPMSSVTASVFTRTANGMVGMKNYEVAKDQSEASDYSGDHIIIDIRTREVSYWVEAQPANLWKWADNVEGCHMSYTRYVMDQRLFTWLTMRWSEVAGQ